MLGASWMPVDACTWGSVEGTMRVVGSRLTRNAYFMFFLAKVKGSLRGSTKTIVLSVG